MKRILSLIISLMFVALAAEAQNNLSFKTEELKKVAAELKLEGLDTLKIGYTFFRGKYVFFISD